MTVFILTVLILASWQSFCKLALLPFRVIGAAAICLMTLPFLFEERIASSSMLNLQKILTDPANLENWCALTVIQELLTVVMGFSLLSDRAESGFRLGYGKRYFFAGCLKKLKYILFLPSFLLPSGVLYFQMYLFNRFADTDFRILTVIVSLFTGVCLILTTVILRIIKRDLELRVLTVLHAEFCLLTAAVFLPVAARAKLMPATEVFDFRSPLYLILGGLGVTILFATVFYYYNQRKGKRFHVNSNSNT